MADLFISYSRKDKEFVRALHAALTEGGRDAWVDWEGIPITADWQREIFDAIEAADAFVFVISPDSIVSEVCGLEVAHAIRYNKRLVPIYHRDVDVGQVDPVLRTYNFVYLRDQDDFDSTVQALLLALDTDQDYVKRHTRLLLRALEWDGKNRDTSYVLRGADLNEAESWLASSASKQPEPGDLHLQYIAASRKAANARQRVTVGSLAAGIVVALLLAALAFYQSNVATAEANSRATAQVIAQNEADSNATAQSVAQTQAAIAQSEADSNATAQSVAVTQQHVAEENAATALAAEATAQRSADEAQAQALAAAAQLALNEDNPELAVALGLDANTIPDPPPGAERTLAEAAYTPAVRRAYAGHLTGRTMADISADGRTIFSGGRDGEVFVWDAVSGEIVHRLQGASSSIDALDLSPDGHRAVTGSCESAEADTIECSSELILWDVDDGTLIRRWTAHNGATWSVVFSPDGKWIASGGNDAQVVIWDAESGALLQQFQGNYGGVQSVAFTVVGDALLGGGGFGMDMWDVKTGKLLRAFGQFLDGLQAIALHPAGREVVAGTGSGDIVMWDLLTAAEIRRFIGHGERVNSVAFSADGTQMISSSGGRTGLDNSIISWDVESGALLRRYEAPTVGNVVLPTQSAIRTVRYTPDGAILSASDDGRVRVWDVENGAVIRRFSGHRLGIMDNALAYSPDGDYIATGTSKIDISSPLASGDGEIYLWDVGVNQPIREFEGHTQLVTGLAFLADSKRLLSASEDERLILWDVASGDLIQSLEGQGSPINALALSGDGRYALSGGEDGQVVIWDIEAMREQSRFTQHSGGIIALATTDDGERAASFAVDGDFGRLVVWDTQTSDVLWQSGEGEVFVTALAFSPDGRYLVSGLFDGSLVLWDAVGGERIGQPFVGHEGGENPRINSVAFSLDGRSLLSGSADTSMILWSVPGGQALRRFRGANWVTGVAFSPDGQRAAAGMGDGNLVLWRIDDLNELIAWTYANRVVREPNCNERIQYRLTPACDENGDFPTHTPYPSLTPSATFTASPTLDLTRITATPTSTSTPTPTATATFTPTVTLTLTPTSAPSTPIPFSDLQRRTAELNLPFTPLLPDALPDGVFIYSITAYIPVEADAPLVTGDIAFLLGVSTNPAYSRDNPDQVMGIVQTTSEFQTVREWGETTDFAPLILYTNVAGYDAAFLRQDRTSGWVIVLRDGLLIRFIYLGLDDATRDAIIQSILPPA